jgi:hypothetical protein
VACRTVGRIMFACSVGGPDVCCSIVSVGKETGGTPKSFLDAVEAGIPFGNKSFLVAFAYFRFWGELDVENDRGASRLDFTDRPRSFSVAKQVVNTRRRSPATSIPKLSI